jgi:hypothetical protein
LLENETQSEKESNKESGPGLIITIGFAVVFLGLYSLLGANGVALLVVLSVAGFVVWIVFTICGEFGAEGIVIPLIASAATLFGLLLLIHYIWY